MTQNDSLFMSNLDDGNVSDAALLSVISSLIELRLPKVEITEKNETKVNKMEKEKILNLRKIPISTTFGEFNGILLIDPTLKETELGR